jgi:hypothetical protein
LNMDEVEQLLDFDQKAPCATRSGVFVGFEHPKLAKLD